ncbi:MAG: LEA type 2 family protein [Deltaproteobacteria bacterium]|nr:LEA type 2 family protein [Deltaproteobacteria bacterium]
MHRRPVRIAALFLVAFLVGGCAALLPRPEPPRLTVADVTLAQVNLFEQKYVVRLRVQNPNAFPLGLVGLDYVLRVNDQPFASGVSSHPVTVPAYGTEVIDVEAYSGLGEVLKQLFELGKGIPERLRYRLRGHVRLESPSLEVPFDESGEISLRPEPPAKGI